MKNSKSLLEERAINVEKMESLVDLCKVEDREMTSEEQVDFDSLNEKVESLSAMAERATKFENIQASNVKKNAPVSEEVRASKSWSLFKAVNELRSGKGLTGLEAEMHQEAEKEGRKGIDGIGIPTMLQEKRAIDQTNSAIAPTAVGAFVESLQEAGLYSKVGVTDLGTVAADTVLPIAGGSTVGWNTEVGAAADGGANFDKLTLSPKRVTGYANLSNQILAQNGPQAEAAVMNDMARNMAVQIDAAMFGSADVTNAPGSIAGTSGVLTFTEAATVDVASDMLEAIQTIANNHGLDGNNAFVNSFELYSVIKAAAQVGSVYPLYVDDLLAGYPGFFSSAPASVAGTSGDGIFGDFSRVYMAQFGPMSIQVDPYTRAVNGEVRLILNNYLDFGVASGASFVKYTALSA
jgi:HK97 family phage major capsid protein